MSLKDKQCKAFFHSNERFADLINGTLFCGEQVISAQNLEEMNSEMNEIEKDRNILQRRRDLLKVHHHDAETAIFGIEFQSTSDKDMVMRMMEYDALTYRHQKRNEGQMVPVISVVLYCGESGWIHSTSLHDQIKVSEWVRRFVPDYRIHLFDALKLKVENYINDELREFVELFQDVHLLNRAQLVEKYKHRRLRSAEAVNAVIVLSRNKELERILMEDEEGKVMCKNFDRIVDEIKNEGRIEGLIEGRTEGLIEGRAEGLIEGKAEGKVAGLETERINTIKRLCNAKVELDLIALASGLNRKEVQELIRSHQISYHF